MTNQQAYVKTDIVDGIGYLEFFNPKANSLPSKQLDEISSSIDLLSKDGSCKVIVVQSGGASAFCAGASFDELKSISSKGEGEKFFSGFSKVILSLKNADKLVVARVHGKVVGGGVGLVAACDYAIGNEQASFKLSELDIGLGPFVIGPAVERKVGTSAFAHMSIDCDWRSAQWAKDNGLLAGIADAPDALNRQVEELAKKLASYSPQAMYNLKRTIWDGTENWQSVLKEKARISGELVLTQHVQKFLKSS